MALLDALYSTVANKCPRCHEGQVFENNNPYSFHNGLTMHTHCPVCHLKYERETGYFYGAMYVSYALQVALFITLYTLDSLWWHLPAAVLLSIIIGCIVAIFPVTFRWSRVLWLGIFTKYEKDFVKTHTKS
jgi:uncharacterized protein (DUF983 family)